MRILVAGAGGFIGGHLVEHYKRLGYWVRGVDIKHPEFRVSTADEFMLLDLTETSAAKVATRGMDYVFQLAADMGGMGYLSQHDADMMRINTRINMNMLEAARINDVKRYFFSSSACVYPDRERYNADLKEDDAYPANPSNEYGWEKLYTERLCKVYTHDYGLDTRVARFHNCYGEFGTWQGGREKAPAALCRKVAVSKLKRNDGTAEIDVWGDGSALRSYIHVDDLVRGIDALMNSGVWDKNEPDETIRIAPDAEKLISRVHYLLRNPINLGSTRMVTVDTLAYTVAQAAGVDLTLNHVDGPVGVKARNADIAMARQLLGWEPEIGLYDGIKRLYDWIEHEVRHAGLV